MIITIDGPVATGKSTIARKLAEALGYIYFDTGAMYRAMTYAIMNSQVDISNSEALQKFLDECDFDLRIHRVGRRYIVNGEDVTEQIRSRDVTSHVSANFRHCRRSRQTRCHPTTTRARCQCRV